MIVVAVVGLARSGKDTVAGILAKKHGFEHFDFYENVISPLMKAQGKKPNKKAAAKFGNEMRAKFGMAVFAERLLLSLKGKEKVVVTGARSLEELRTLEKEAQRFYIVKVEAPEAMRFQRRSDLDPKKEEDFFDRDKDDLENKGLTEVLRTAQFTIENAGTLKELEEKAKALAEKVEAGL
ncbi:MAG: hypothetical protein NT067_00475 [Candidatus Diapherotrites archaeon]|nr:hypothetical protein [Candidatus Diapherotrites archaeon]